MRSWILFLACLAVVLPCQGRTITVDDDGPAEFNNIQAAINDANDGDIVVVSPGRYTGDGNRDIDFGGRGITVRSENGLENCIIDCEKRGRAFDFHSGEDANSVLEGLTIKNGVHVFGGAIRCNQSSPTIARLFFRMGKVSLPWV